MFVVIKPWFPGHSESHFVTAQRRTLGAREVCRCVEGQHRGRAVAAKVSSVRTTGSLIEIKIVFFVYCQLTDTSGVFAGRPLCGKLSTTRTYYAIGSDDDGESASDPLKTGRLNEGGIVGCSWPAQSGECSPMLVDSIHDGRKEYSIAYVLFHTKRVTHVEPPPTQQD